jgi:hypothetical protein
METRRGMDKATKAPPAMMREVNMPFPAIVVAAGVGTDAAKA